jgi:lipoate-protein ligase A
LVFKLDVWRLLRLETHDAFTNMAVDEAILTARIEGLVPDTLRLYCWRPSAVSIGKFQKAEDEVQMENCLLQGIDIVRRITGGGAVYHDAEGEVTYSVVAGREKFGGGIGDVYAEIYSGLAQALSFLGVKADFSEGSVRACPNLTVNGKKVSGSAQCHKRGVVLQHGTILVNVDLERMFKCLRVAWTQSCVKVLGVAKRKITSLRDQMGKNVSAEEMSHALIEGFQSALSIRLVNGELTTHEHNLAEILRRQKYATDCWTYPNRSVCASDWAR